MAGLQDLEARVEALERRVGVGRRGTSVSQSLTELEGKFDSLMTDQLQEFLGQYEKLASMIMTADNIEDLLQSTETKRTIVLSSDKYIRDTAEQLAQIQNMEKYVAPECIKQTPRIQEKLKPIVSLHLEQKEAHDMNSARFNELLQRYNEFVAVVSQKFIYYDQLLQIWEKRAGVKA